MSRLKLKFFIFTQFFLLSCAQISDKRLCADENCQTPVSRAKTLTKYFSPNIHQLSFNANEDVLIYSKSAGSNKNLWGVEIKGKRGYVPYKLIRETKILIRPTILVNTEFGNNHNVPQVPLKQETVEPTKVKENYEVIDGTTLYFPPEDEAVPSSDDLNNTTQSSIQVTTETPEVSQNSGSFETSSAQTSQDDVNHNAFERPSKLDEQNLLLEDSKEEESGEIGQIEVKVNDQNVSSETIDTGSDKELKIDTLNSSAELNEVDQHQEKQNDESSKEATIDSDVKIIDAIEDLIENNVVKKEGEESAEKLTSTHNSFLVSSEDEATLKPTESSNIELNLQNISTSINSNETVTIEENILNSDSKEEQKESHVNDIESIKDTNNKNNSKSDSIDTNILNNVQDIENKTSYESVGTNPEITIKDTEDEISNSTQIEFTNSQENVIEKTDSINSESEHDQGDVEVELPEHKENNETILKESYQQSESEISNPEILLVDENKSDNIHRVDLKEEIPAISDKKDSEFDPQNNIITNYLTGYQTQEDTLQHKYKEISLSIDSFHKTNDLKDSSVATNTELGKEIIESIPTVPISSHTIDEPPLENNDEVEINQNSEENSTETQQNTENEDELSILQNPASIHTYIESASKKGEVSSVSETMDNEEQVSIGKYNIQDVNDELNGIYEDAHCTKEECPDSTESSSASFLKDLALSMELPVLNSDIILYLVTTAISVIIFLLGHFALDKSRRERPLVAKINKLEKEFLILLKEKEILTQQIESNSQESDYVKSQDFLNLQNEKQALEEQVQTLEKELENSTELGLELNRMLSDVLSSDNAGQTLMLNIEGLQAQLAEQQGIVSNMKEMLSLKETENHELHLELDIANKRAAELQTELDKLLLNIIKIEEEKESLEKSTESEISQLRENINSLNKKILNNQDEYSQKIDELSKELSSIERRLQVKTKEYNGLKDTIQQLKNMKNTNNFDSLVNVNSVKAELEQLKSECKIHSEQLSKEKETNSVLEKRAKSAEDEMIQLKNRFDEVDKAKLELETKLQVLTNYFKEKEEELQKELSKYESMWSEKQGEATSTSERIKYLQSEVQNYKAQNETLKQEIVSQEVELKSQISVLEKKVHENWVSARQAERRLEDMKQEAAQLRNRLTLRERAIQEDSVRKRMQSPLDQSNDITSLSPIHLENPSSPPLLYTSREHITKSPPILGMPPPFLPPPPGAPFLPPPHLPFMPPPPPDMYPGDHRPPPLGRMSSPPLNSRYSPDRRSYSPYEGRSPSPSYDESEYGTSPVHRRRYSPFNGRRDRRRTGKINGRGGTMSSGSGNSNESLDEMSHSNLKV